jgi:hypothetical protein
MGEPVIIWPPGCGNFAAGDDQDGGTICAIAGGYADCTSYAQSFDEAFEDGGYYQNAVADGNLLCCLPF